MSFERLKKGLAMPPLLGVGQSERPAVAFPRGGVQDQDGISMLSAAGLEDNSGPGGGND